RLDVGADLVQGDYSADADRGRVALRGGGEVNRRGTVLDVGVNVHVRGRHDVDAARGVGGRVLKRGQAVRRLLGAQVGGEQGVEGVEEKVLRLDADRVEGKRHADRGAVGDRRVVNGGLGRHGVRGRYVDVAAGGGRQAAILGVGVGATEDQVCVDDAVDRQ